MIITFLGHSSLYNCCDLYDKVKNAIIENTKPDEETVFYCGGYGDFDNLCASVCRSLKDERSKLEIIFVTPYLTESQQQKTNAFIKSNLYDSIIYPPLESTPKKFAIIKRNEWMVEKSDLIIAYVNLSYGGAYKALAYAKKKKKTIINLADTD